MEHFDAQALEGYFSSLDLGQNYPWSSLPFGWKYSPVICQRLMGALAENSVFDLQVSVKLQGKVEGVLCAFCRMYDQLTRMFKIKGCLGAWWAATNGVPQGCPLSAIVINALTTTWKHKTEDVK